MNLTNAKNMADLIAQANPTKPQVLVAGWFTDDNAPVGGVCVVAGAVPTKGELLVSTACCLVACLTKLGELAGDDKASRQAVINIVMGLAGGLEVVRRLKHELFTGAVAPGPVERARTPLLEAALRNCVSALDALLGDTDLPDDDRPGVLAMRAAIEVLEDPENRTGKVGS